MCHHLVVSVNSPFGVSFKQDANKPVELKVIADVCLVIDVLGGDFRSVGYRLDIGNLLTTGSRNHIIERYLQLQLAEYRRIFRSTDEVRSSLVPDREELIRDQAGQLDNVPRRYAWFRRVLKHHDDEDASLFPPTWEVTRLLVASFAEYTRGDLANVLGKATPNVTTLLDALQSTLDFEAAFIKRFDKQVCCSPPHAANSPCLMLDCSSRRFRSAGQERKSPSSGRFHPSLTHTSAFTWMLKIGTS